MLCKLIGSCFIVGSCSFYSISYTLHQKKEIRLLNELNSLIDSMICELSYRLTPLPVLIRHCAISASGSLAGVFLLFADYLDAQTFPDASCCMEAALHDAELSFSYLCSMLFSLGRSLGRFDLDEQLRELSALQSETSNVITQCINRSTHGRVYRVLGICAGLSLAILFF